MFERLLPILQHNCQLDPDKPVLLGVSGGPDSLCLLDLMQRLGWKVVVAHFNHALRGESAQDQLAVEQYALKMGLPFVTAQGDVRGYAREHMLSIEEAGRVLRYRFLFDQAYRIAAQAVAVAHTADDQVETVLMHLLRGAGLSGLKGMVFRMSPNPWSQDIPLVRPLLAFWREEIQAYVDARSLLPVIDQSNFDVTFYRNRLRHELVPFLEELHPGARKAILRLSVVLAQDAQIVDQAVEQVWQDCLLEKGEGYLFLSLQALQLQMEGMRSHLIRRAIGILRPGLRDIGFDDICRGMDFIDSPTRTRRIDLVAGLYMFIEGDRLGLAAWETDLPGGEHPQLTEPEYIQTLQVPGEIALGGGWLLSSEVYELDERMRMDILGNSDPYRVYADQATLQIPLSVRGRRPGDRFRPLGMGEAPVKLSDFMINKKIQHRFRDAWPLVCSGEQIVWVAGFMLGDLFRISENTRRVVRLQLIHRS